MNSSKFRPRMSKAQRWTLPSWRKRSPATAMKRGPGHITSRSSGQTMTSRCASWTTRITPRETHAALTSSLGRLRSGGSSPCRATYQGSSLPPRLLTSPAGLLSRSSTSLAWTPSTTCRPMHLDSRISPARPRPATPREKCSSGCQIALGCAFRGRFSTGMPKNVQMISHLVLNVRACVGRPLSQDGGINTHQAAMGVRHRRYLQHGVNEASTIGQIGS